MIKLVSKLLRKAPSNAALREPSCERIAGREAIESLSQEQARKLLQDEEVKAMIKDALDSLPSPLYIKQVP